MTYDNPVLYDMLLTWLDQADVICPIINSSPPGQNGRHFAYDIFRCIVMNQKFVFW